MGRSNLNLVEGSVIKRRTSRLMGVFVDASGLDHATKRLGRKVEIAKLLSSLTSGAKLELARYYCLLPYEDDSRQSSFLLSVERSGFEVITKRLPPKVVKKQVSLDTNISCDMINFCYSYFQVQQLKNSADSKIAQTSDTEIPQTVKRIITLVCPSPEIRYATSIAKKLNTSVVLADFGSFTHSSGWQGIDHWIDLSSSESIWREE